MINEEVFRQKAFLFFFFFYCCSYNFRLMLHCPVKNEKGFSVLWSRHHNLCCSGLMVLSLSAHTLTGSVTYCDEQPEIQHVQGTPALITQGMTQKQSLICLKPFWTLEDLSKRRWQKLSDLPKLKILLSWGAAEWLIHHSMRFVVAKLFQYYYI